MSSSASATRAGSARERAAERPAASWFLSHLAALAVVILLLELPRAVGPMAELFSPVYRVADDFCDFDTGYHPAGRLIIEDPGRLYTDTKMPSVGLPPEPDEEPHFVNLPIVAWVFAPFALFSLETGRVLWLLAGSVATLAALLLVQRRLGPGTPWVARWAITAAFASSGPMMNTLNLGQTSGLVLLMLVLFERALAEGRDRRAGLWLGAICLLKVPPVLLLPWLAWRGRLTVVASAVALGCAAIVASVALYGVSLHEEYVRVAFLSNAGGVPPGHTSQSIGSALARLAPDADLYDWTPVRLSSAMTALMWGLRASLLLVLVWALRGARSVGHHRLLLEMGLVLCFSLVALPLYWSHYALWLVPVAAATGAAVHRCSKRPWPALLPLALAVFLLNLPVSSPALVQSMQGELWFRLAVSHVLVGTVLLFAVTSYWVRRLPAD